MEGKEVFKHAVVNMAAVVGEVLEKAGLTAKDIDWLVPHQANKRIIDGTGRKLGLPPERVVVTVDKHANTSAASIPLALDTAVRTAVSRRGICCCWKALAAAWPGALRSSAGSSEQLKQTRSGGLATEREHIALQGHALSY